MQRWYLFMLGLRTLGAYASTLTERGKGEMDFVFDLCDGTYLRKHRYQDFCIKRFRQPESPVKSKSFGGPQFFELLSELVARTHVLPGVNTQGGATTSATSNSKRLDHVVALSLSRSLSLSLSLSAPLSICTKRVGFHNVSCTDRW